MSRTGASPLRLAAALHQAVGSRLWLVLALMLAGAALEAATIAMLIPLLALAGVPMGAGATDTVYQILRDVLSGLAIPATLPAALGVFVTIVAVRGAVILWRDQARVQCVTRFTAVIRRRLYQAIGRSRWEYFAHRRASDLSHALIVDVGLAGTATGNVLFVLAETVVCAAYLAFALTIAPWFTIIAMIAGVVLLLLVQRYSTRSLAHGRETLASAGDLARLTSEHLAGMKVAKGFGTVGRHLDDFGAADERLLNQYVQMARDFHEAEFWRQLGSAVILSIALVVAITLLRLPLGDIVLLLFIFARVVPRVTSLQGQLQHIAADLPAFDRVSAMISQFADHAEPLAEPRPLALTQAIALKAVTYRYLRGEVPALLDVTLTIPAGSTTALVGPSGAGKSTVVEMVMGLLTPETGAVEVDGVRLDSSHLESWRAQIGYVPQDIFLFHDTIRQNLLWAKPSAAEPELWEALRMASAEDFVRRLPQGLDTVVSDRGVRLSGGEKQRLALARALIRRPALLILDEATSALDVENEERILAAAERLRGAMTILIVSHRLSTVRGADLIHVLEEGTVVESGSWSSLFARSGRLRALLEAQR